MRLLSIKMRPAGYYSDLSAFLDTYAIEMRTGGAVWLRVPVLFLGVGPDFGPFGPAFVQTNITSRHGSYAMTIGDPSDVTVALFDAGRQFKDSGEENHESRRRWPFYVAADLSIIFDLEFERGQIAPFKFAFRPGCSYVGLQLPAAAADAH
jgi:hypothetical protein